MADMSNLHCPNCDHLIGTLQLAETPRKASPDNTNHVRAWMAFEGWEGWEPTTVLYPRFEVWCRGMSLDPLSPRRFTLAAIAAGARWKKTNKGRVYARS